MLEAMWCAGSMQRAPCARLIVSGVQSMVNVDFDFYNPNPEVDE